MATLVSDPKSTTRSCVDVGVVHIFSFFRPDFTGEGINFEKIRPFISVNGPHNDVLGSAAAGARSSRRNHPYLEPNGARQVLRPSASQIERLLRSLWLISRHGRAWRSLISKAIVVCRAATLAKPRRCVEERFNLTITGQHRNSYASMARKGKTRDLG